jgi:hypothetical protein
MVPRVDVPAGEYSVLTSALPRTGPDSSNGVSGVMRRLKGELRTTAKVPPLWATSTTEMPCAGISLFDSAAGRGRALAPLACRKWSVSASWFIASRPRVLLVASRVPVADRPK